jgi:hypothetical protein
MEDKTREDAYGKELKRVTLDVTMDDTYEHQPLPPDEYRPEDNLDGCRAIMLWVGAAAALLIASFLYIILKHH